MNLIGPGPGWSIPAGEWPAVGRRLRLSRQQLRIARLMAETDLTYAAIASKLSIGVASVKNPVERMYHKLDVHSRHGLIRRILAEHQRITEEGK